MNEVEGYSNPFSAVGIVSILFLLTLGCSSSFPLFSLFSLQVGKNGYY